MCNIEIPKLWTSEDVEGSGEKRECAGVKLPANGPSLSPSCEGCSCLPPLRQMEVAVVWGAQQTDNSEHFLPLHTIWPQQINFGSAWEEMECGWALANARNAFPLCRASVG